MSKPQIMVVEDEFVIAADIQDILKALGYEVSAIESTGKAAVEKAKEMKPDLVLMDIVLKGKMDGIEAAEQIRSRWGIPVVYLTAYTNGERMERAGRTKLSGYLVKPINPERLRSAIEKALGRSVD